MAKFSPISLDRLETAHPDLRRLFCRVIETGFDCLVICGHREQAVQNKLYAEDKSKLPWPKSKHNAKPALAVDVAPFPVDWEDEKRFYHFGGYVRGLAAAMRIPIRWGGDWDSDFQTKNQSFFDLMHFELKEQV